MKNLFVLTSLILVSAFIFNGCKKDKDETPEPVDPNTVSITVSGVVYDISLNPMSNVTVTLGAKTATTDFNGLFYFSSTSVPKERFTITFSKPGYFTLSRSAEPVSGVPLDIQVGLISETDFNYAGTASFSSTSPYNFTMTNGCSISFPADAFVTSSGGTFSGNVNVRAAYLDPTMQNYSMFVFGGDLHGKDSLGIPVMLNPFSGLNVVITDDTDNKLQLDAANSKKADVTMQIPNPLISSAPASIDLLEYDANSGLCMASGSASKTGDKYMGQVGHFSFWSCQKIFTGKATISGTVTNASGEPVAGVKIHVGTSSANSAVFAVTDKDGNYFVKFPSGLAGVVSILPHYFGTFITPQTFAALPDDGTFTADFQLPDLRKVTGRLVNCTGSPVSGRVVLSWYSSTMGTTVNTSCFTGSDGTFNFNVETAASSANLNAWGNNTDTSKFVSFFGNPQDLGDITLCPPLQLGPTQVTFTGGQFTTATTFSSFNTDKYGRLLRDSVGTAKHIEVSAYGTDGSIYVYVNGITTGTFNVGTKSGFTTASFYIYSNPYFSEELVSGQVKITKFGIIGGLIEGNYSGQTTSGVNVSGVFSVQRGSDLIGGR